MALKVIEGGQHALIQANGSSDDLNSAFNVIKTTNTSNEIIFAKEYNYSNHKVGNSFPGHSMGSDATQWKDANGNTIFHPSGNVLENIYLPCDMIINSYEPADIRGHEKQFFFKEYTDATGVTHTLNNYGNWAWFDEKSLMEGHDGDYDMPTFRYSEVLLSLLKVWLVQVRRVKRLVI